MILAVTAAGHAPNLMDAVGGELPSLVAILIVFASGLWLKRRQRRMLRGRPPEQAKLLRPPGFGLQLRFSELKEKADWILAQLIGAGAIFGISWPVFHLCFEVLSTGALAQVFGRPAVSFISVVAVLALVWTVWSLIRLLKLHETIRTCRLGLRGEQAVAEVMTSQTLAGLGYRCFHDVHGDGRWNIDHVVIGPAGILVLETKTRSKRRSLNGQKEVEVIFDGRSLQFPWCRDDCAAAQASRNADWIRLFVKAFAPEGLIAQPIVVIPGWYVVSTGKHAVLAMNQNYLAGFLAREPK